MREASDKSSGGIRVIEGGFPVNTGEGLGVCPGASAAAQSFCSLELGWKVPT